MRNSYVAAFFVALASGTLVLSAPGRAVAEEGQAESISIFGQGQMEVPASFERTEPGSRILEHEFKVTEGDKAARLTMMRAGGGIQANIKRWKGQFTGGKEEDQKVKTMNVGPFEVHLVDVSGTYAERMGGGPFFGGKVVQRPDYAMTGAIIVSEKGPTYFVKMIGPAEVVQAKREKFVGMIKSIGS
jgi:hypothetical protein